MRRFRFALLGTTCTALALLTVHVACSKHGSDSSRDRDQITPELLLEYARNARSEPGRIGHAENLAKLPADELRPLAAAIKEAIAAEKKNRIVKKHLEAALSKAEGGG